jgi:hypothetical protein
MSFAQAGFLFFSPLEGETDSHSEPRGGDLTRIGTDIEGDTPLPNPPPQGERGFAEPGRSSEARR